MRTTVLATLLGLSLIGCAGQISGGGGDDDDIPENCGNGATDTGEACDDGNITSGDGCSASCQTEAVPRVAVVVDKPTVTTDLIAENSVTVTVSSVDGFTGNVNLAASMVDSASAPITDWVASVTPAVVTVPEGGSATAVVAFSIPGDTAAMTGTLKLAATGGPTQIDTTVSITANPVATITFTTQGTLCKYPGFDATKPLKLKVGRQLKVVDGGQLPMTIHFDTVANTGISHQGGPMDLNAAYTQTTTGVTGGNQLTFYCHSPDTLNGVNVATDGVNDRQVLVITP